MARRWRKRQRNPVARESEEVKNSRRNSALAALGIAEFFESTRDESLGVPVRRHFARALRSAAINYGEERKGGWCRGGSGERLSGRGVSCFDVGYIW